MTAPVLGLYPFRMYAIRRHNAARNAWCWSVDFTRRGKLHQRRFYDFRLTRARRLEGMPVPACYAEIVW